MAWVTAAITAVQRGKDATVTGFKHDWGGVAVNSLAAGGKIAEAIFKAKMSEAFKKTAEAAAKKAGLPTPTYILDAMGLAIIVVSLLNGFGDERGSCFTTAKALLDNVTSELGHAAPLPDEWSGEAADAYAAMLTKLQNYVETMDGYDKGMKNLVVMQADAVKNANNIISYCTLVLIAAYIPALALYAWPAGGAAASYGLQAFVALGVGIAVLAGEGTTSDNAHGIAKTISAMITDYETLQKNVTKDLAGDFGDLEAELQKMRDKKTQETSVGSFTAISDGLSEFSSAAPTVASLANMAGENVSPTQRALLDAANGNGDLAAAAVAGATETAPAAAPAVATAPQTVGQLGQTVGQVSQGVQQGRQVAQPSQGAAKAADKDGTEEDAAAGRAEGAASGTGPAERAPVGDVAGAGAAGDRPGRVL